MVFAAGMAALVYHYWRQLMEDDDVYSPRWLIGWMVKGMALPVLAWALLNAGRHPVLPAMIPLTPPANAGWFGHLAFSFKYVVIQTEPALFVISSYWAALTLAWLIVAAAARMEERQDFLLSAVVWCGLLLPIVALMFYVYGASVMGLALLFFWAWPLAHHALGQRPRKTAPFYARAVASIKFGKYADAERAIIAELEKCETDFEGWMMLAELYAGQFHDLPEAERTVLGLCAEPQTTPPQVAIALNRLADWQLQLGQDPVAARHSLEEICRRLPGTHLAKMAAVRIGQLPASKAELHEQKKIKTIHLPALSEEFGHGQDANAPTVNRTEALAQADECVRKLRQDPNDVPTREKLALIFAEQLGKIELASEQIESLMEMPEQPPAKMAEWLAMLAGWQLRFSENPETARRFLERLIHEHPHSVQAFAAQRRLTLLDMDARAARPETATGAAPATS